MMKWIVLSLTTLCSFTISAAEELDSYKTRYNPSTMDYYVEHYQDPNSQEYRDLLIGVRVAADTMNFYTTRLDARNQRIDYCLPMKNTVNRESLDNWKTKDLITIINNSIKRDPMLQKYGKAGIGGSIASYLTAALKEQYPCPVQKQL